MGKTITNLTTKTTRQQATKWRQNDKSATMIQVDNRLLSPEQELSSSSQIWQLLVLTLFKKSCSFLKDAYNRFWGFFQCWS